jgi:pimeloyl-ACP methyl ester carboxylesterase
VLLLVHGFPTGSWDWHALWPSLVERYRVLALDLIGLGFSDKPRRFPYTIAAQADLVTDVLGREGVRECRVLAHDIGDTVTQELLARQREDPAAPRIIAACLLNGGLFPETHRALPIQRLLARPVVGPLLGRLIPYRGFARNMRRTWGEHPLEDADLRALWQLVTYGNGRAVLGPLLGYMAERRRHRERWVGAIADGAVPLRLVNGSADPVSGAHLAARYREVVTKPDIVELPGVGHYPQLEAPEAVRAAVLPFLARP